MPASINYKNKYLELRTKYIADIDVAFRLGFEQGAQEAKQQQVAEAHAQTQEAEMRMQEAHAAGMNGQPGNGGPPDMEGGNSVENGQPPAKADGAMPADKPMPQDNPAQAGAAPSSELDQHIGKLESMLVTASPEVQKSLKDIIDLRKAEKMAFDLKKGDAAVKGIVAALHKPAFKVGAQANHNLNSNAKAAVTLQHKIVTDIFKSWAEEESNAKKDISAILGVEGVTKG